MRYDREFGRHVLSLVDETGLELDELRQRTVHALLEMLEDERMNDHECALAFAYECVGHLLLDDWERARVLFVRTEMLQQEWVEKGLINVSRLARFATQADQQLRQANA